MLVASIEVGDPMQPVDIEERQKLKDLEDQIIDIMTVLESTKDNIVCLIEKYNQCRRDFGRGVDTSDDAGFDPIDFALRDKRRDVVSNRKKVETLHIKIKSTIELVSRNISVQFQLSLSDSGHSKLSSLLNLGNGHALELLAEEARRENINIRRLTEKGTRDAAAVKVLTIITLIYLPATVVSVSL